MDTLQSQILDSTAEIFSRSGLNFTMQDVAKEMHISKKTIYTAFPSKEELLNAMLDRGFELIHRAKEAILSSDMPPAEKLRKVMIALPDEFASLDYRQMDHLEEKYPMTAARLAYHLESNWEPVDRLIRQGMEEGWLRKDLDLPILKISFSATLRSFLFSSGLEQNQIPYTQALDRFMDLLMAGMLARPAETSGH